MKRALAVSLVLLGVAAGCSGDDDAHTSAGAPRTVTVVMRDNDFDPAGIQVSKGETVKFVFTNKGSVAHDAFIGDTTAQAAHESAMHEGAGASGDHGGMEHSGSDDDAVTVEPAHSGDLTYTFRRAGAFEIGCHQPGHYGAGMKIDITVS
jgi:uncharacterized cupredoxin-like copper-binding protein